jgi:hypothetical protein
LVVAKVAIIHWKMLKKWRPWEDLAKFGYKPEIKYISLIILHCLWLHDENQTKSTKSGDFYQKKFLTSGD